MIKIEEYRTGNIVLQKINTRIIPAVLTIQHFATIASGNTKDFFPLFPMFKNPIILMATLLLLIISLGICTIYNFWSGLMV